jgi:2-polyprenyl-3-methyl-5-hydroxy-6-metoxy-1,4-benzoquinol methylase
MRVVRRMTRDRHVVQCAACRVSALRPVPTFDELERHYADYYLTRDKTAPRHEWLVDAHRPIVDWLLSHLREPVSQPAFLDFGFGSGEFLVHVAQRGHLAYGSDLSARAMGDLGSIALRTGLDLRPVGLEELTTTSSHQPIFDIVTLFQTIEHLAQPLAVVRTLAGQQRSGGLLYLECPNNASGVAWLKSFFLYGERRSKMWRSLKYPEHLHGFTRRSLESLVTAAGYDVLDSGDYGYGDGRHQVESEFWWPTWRQNPTRWTPYGASRSVIRMLDSFLSSTVKLGSGLFALGRKR